MRDATHHQAEVAAALGEAQPPVGQAALVAPRHFAHVPVDLNAPTSGDPVHVVANHGRWTVNCPDCHGAQLTAITDKRFLCNLCGNVGNARRFRPVAWPKDHEKIGALLDSRADRRLRNWSPGETVADLERENQILTPTVPGWAGEQWQGHAHHWPKVTKALKGDDIIECRDCGLPYPASEVYPEAFS